MTICIILIAGGPLVGFMHHQAIQLLSIITLIIKN
jgi:hypothetical protein